MRKRVVFCGAGLTKALQMPGYAVPMLADFVAVAADHLSQRPVQVTMASLVEYGIISDVPAGAVDLAKKVNAGPPPSQVLEDLARILRDTGDQNIESLLKRAGSMAKGAGFSASGINAGIAPQRVCYAMNAIFCAIGWNYDFTPLRRFVRPLIRDTRATFVTFNYDLALEKALVDEGVPWSPTTGYGLEIREGFPISAGTVHSQHLAQGSGAYTPLNTVAIPRNASSVTILKPHGSLNWLLPFDGNYNYKVDGGVIVAGTGNLEYFPAYDLPQTRPGGAAWPANHAIFVVPPEPPKAASLNILDQLRSHEIDAITSADEVYVIGWSMPPTDTPQRELIKSTVARRSRPIKRLSIVSFRSSEELFERVRETFGVPKCRTAQYNDGFKEFADRFDPPGCVSFATGWRSRKNH